VVGALTMLGAGAVRMILQRLQQAAALVGLSREGAVQCIRHHTMQYMQHHTCNAPQAAAHLMQVQQQASIRLFRMRLGWVRLMQICRKRPQL